MVSVANSSCLTQEFQWTERNRRLDALGLFSVDLAKAKRGLIDADSPLSNLPEYFTQHPVYVPASQIEIMEDFIALLGERSRSLKYQTALRQHWPGKKNPWLASLQQESLGVFFGYDFHLSEQGPKLIEINTNAGGAYLNYLLSTGQSPCCHSALKYIQQPLAPEFFEQHVVDSFHQEYFLGKGRVLSSIAIVDEAPNKQFLHQEFLLFQQLFQAAGIETYILSPDELTLRRGKLYFGNRVIDLVYNRLTDFYFLDAASKTLREALLQNAAVITPNPMHYSCLADKSLLVLLNDSEFLLDAGFSHDEQLLIHSVVPKTSFVSGFDAEKLWQQRKNYFFKPRNGFGSRASYSGRKLTKKTFSQILQSDYLVQEYVPAEVREIDKDGGKESFKTDLRIYTYGSEPLLMAARMYQGQTTNMRTQGGGFAPVLQLNRLDGEQS